MIWSRDLDDGSCLYVESAFLPHNGYRPTREYLVLFSERSPASLKDAVAICKTDDKGIPVIWYSANRMHWEPFLEGLSEALLVEQVMET